MKDIDAALIWADDVAAKWERLAVRKDFDVRAALLEDAARLRLMAKYARAEIERRER